jgi:hypothetical protein
MTLGAVSTMIAVLPFRKVVGLAARNGRLTRSDLATVSRCSWVVDAWADRVPWRAVCFQRGLALHLMLRRRGIPSVLHYGVAQNEDKGLHAHVWVDVNCQTVMGGEESLARFARLASFPAAPQD